jgi:uncharacterized membrane protein YdjX (TVP38/TMEM64 family)
LLIALSAAIGLGNADFTVLIIAGITIALAATLAKSIHYMVTFFVSGRLSQKRQERLNADAAKVRRWAFPLLFLVAASPVPDEPVIIPLGLMKYSPLKFFVAYFLGKLAITVAGALLGSWAGNFVENWFGLTPEATFALSIAVSVILTVVVTVILLKVDLDKVAQKYLHKKPKGNQEKPYKPSEEPNTDDEICPRKDVTP